MPDDVKITIVEKTEEKRGLFITTKHAERTIEVSGNDPEKVADAVKRIISGNKSPQLPPSSD